MEDSAAELESNTDDSYADLEAEYEIVGHEQAHASVMAKTSRERSFVEDEEGESRWSRSPGASSGNLAEPFLDSFAGMINRENLQSLLKDQSHM